MGEKTVPIPVRVLVSGFGVLEQFAVASVAQEMTRPGQHDTVVLRV
jgi:hypothetical protein